MIGLVILVYSVVIGLVFGIFEIANARDENEIMSATSHCNHHLGNPF